MPIASNPLPLSATHEGWLAALKNGDASSWKEGVNASSADDRFRMGYACAVRNIPQGVELLVDVLPGDDIRIMGIHWLEAAILNESYEVANLVRSRNIDPFKPFEKARSFESGAVFQRRNQWTSRWLDEIKQGRLLDDVFLEQWKSSRLPDVFLFRAIHHQPLSTVDYLLSLGSSANRSTEAYVPLWGALRAGKADVMELLLGKGASINDAGMLAGKTLLVHAAERGLVDCVRLLMGAGASVSDRSCGIDAPHAARIAGHVDLASSMEATVLQHQPAARGAGQARRL